MTVKKRNIVRDNDGTIRAQIEFDTGEAMRIAKEITNNGGGGGDPSKSGSIRLIGTIPPELFQCDPWLIQANKARAHGDKEEYSYWIMKFFEVHPEYKVFTPSKFL